MDTQLADEPAATSATGSQSARRALSSSAAMSLLAVIGLTTVGIAIRVVVANQSIFADELSTYWISATHSLRGVLSLMYGTPHIQHAEITPPLYFLAAWVTTRFGHSVLLLRAPALVAGVVTIPLVYLLGRRLVGRSAALVATALTALSPFMIYYSGEARSYGLMMALVLGSTLSMLLAVDTGRARWWVVYGACSWGAFLTHYTSAFVLAVQFVWVVWAHPEARRGALIANLGAGAAVLPWLPGLIQDFRSPTLTILSALSPFTPHEIWQILQHWSVGYPFDWAGGLSMLPGTAALILLAISVIVAGVGLAQRLGSGALGPRIARIDRRLLLTVLLALAVPVGEAVVSAAGNHIFGVRNLAASWPYLALAFSALLIASGRRVGLVAAGLAIAAFAFGAVVMLSARFARPNFKAASRYIAAHVRPGDVVLDETGSLSPGPLTAVDVTLHTHAPVIRAAAPAERGHPFGFGDPLVPYQEGVKLALASARGHRVFVIENAYHIAVAAHRVVSGIGPLPASYRIAQRHVWTGIAPTLVYVLAPTGTPSQ
jgi:4-amino-4-deoxy-L-arabinose transferase-like glycosyltransferase